MPAIVLAVANFVALEASPVKGPTKLGAVTTEPAPAVKSPPLLKVIFPEQAIEVNVPTLVIFGCAALPVCKVPFKVSLKLLVSKFPLKCPPKFPLK